MERESEGSREERRDWVTVQEAARGLDISLSTLYRYVRLYRLTVYRRIGDRRSYLSVADLESLRGFQPKAQ
jgi:hypothetical protein